MGSHVERQSWRSTLALACALVLRTELLGSSIVPASLSDSHLAQDTSDPMSMLSILPEGLIDCIKSNSKFTWSIAYPQSDLAEVLSKLKSDATKPRLQPEARLVYPVKGNFRKYDLFLVFYDADGGCDIFGYQFKKNDKLTKDKPEAGVDRSFLVRGDAAETPRKDTDTAQSGWIVVSKIDCLKFMGPTLWPILKFEDIPPSGGDTQASEADSDDENIAAVPVEV